MCVYAFLLWMSLSVIHLNYPFPPFSVVPPADHPIMPVTSVLDPGGAFSIVNALRLIQPGKQHVVKVRFAPTHPVAVMDTLTVTCEVSSATCTEGVRV